MNLATGATAPGATPRGFGPAPDARGRLVAALAAVEGISAHASAPDNPAAFDAWPRWALSDYHLGRLGLVGSHQYDVLVILPAGYEPDTITEGDSLLGTVVAALWDTADVGNADPIQLTFGVNNPAMPALRIRVTPRVTP